MSVKNDTDYKSGDKIGALTVVSGPKNVNGYLAYDCLCICGETRSYLKSNLKRRNTQRCSCIRVNKQAHHREIEIYQGILKRIFNKKSPNYARYGGRGIKVCPKWANSFYAFLKDMGKCPSPKHSIDRINNDGDYILSNCRWATSKQQNRNRSNNAILEFRGERKTVSEWGEIYGMKCNTIQKRIKKMGMSVEEALTTPIMTLAESARRAVAVREGKKCKNMI